MEPLGGYGPHVNKLNAQINILSMILPRVK